MKTPVQKETRPKPVKKPTTPPKKSVSKIKPVQDINEIRNNVKMQLPMMFQNALDAYHAILNAVDEEDHKLIQARHNAARTALNHVQQLVKLGDWALQEEENTQNDVYDLARLIAEARAEMEQNND